MITALRQSNAQDEHEPTFVEMIKQRTTYENLLEIAGSEFGYYDTPDFHVHETPTTTAVKSQPAKRKDGDGFSSPAQGKVSKHNLTYEEKF
ncbi:hypothetical protein TNCV_2089961 [Trichonephila clavipes]|nr:hypothetical protein TNCV_2089961 [Trichonephila clavipes]